jgi:hypothetical protein
LKTYLVFEPADGTGGAESADRVLFLREKFRWSALFFAPLWMLWHRLWLGLILWLAAEIVIAGAAYAAGLTPEAAAPLLWLPTLIVAFESTELLRRKLLRKGYREAAVKIGNNLEDAERRFFSEWSLRPQSRLISSVPKKSAPAPAPAVMSAPALATSPVVGSFPEPGIRK